MHNNKQHRFHLNECFTVSNLLSTPQIILNTLVNGSKHTVLRKCVLCVFNLSKNMENRKSPSFKKENLSPHWKWFMIIVRMVISWGILYVIRIMQQHKDYILDSTCKCASATSNTNTERGYNVEWGKKRKGTHIRRYTMCMKVYYESLRYQFTLPILFLYCLIPEYCLAQINNSNVFCYPHCRYWYDRSPFPSSINTRICILTFKFTCCNNYCAKGNK